MEQITDHRGNNFTPSKQQAVLYKAGWRLVERRKIGCMWMIRWADPTDGTVWGQGTAVEIQKGRKMNVK